MFLIVPSETSHSAECSYTLQFAAKRLSFLGGGKILRFSSWKLAMAAKCALDPAWAGDAYKYPAPTEGAPVCIVGPGYKLVENTVFPEIL